MTFGHVARQASIRFSGLAFDKVLGYVFALFVAKTYGSTAFGLYIFGVGCFEVAYALAELGLERASIRAVADAVARGREAEVKGIVHATLALMLPLGVAIAIGAIAFASPFALALDRPDLAPFLQLAAIAIPASLVADAHLWATEGLGFQRFTVLVRMVIEPVVKVAVAVVLFRPFAATTEAEPLAVAYAGAFVASAALGYGIYRRFVVPRAAGRPAEAHTAELLRVGLPLCGLALLTRVLAWWDVFLIFTFVSPIATTHYAVAFRTAMLTIMIASAFDAAFRPRIAAALAVDRRGELAREFHRVSRAVLMLCLPATVMLLAFPARVAAALGGQFTASAPVIAIVALGTLGSFLAGPAASALTMAGRSRVPLANAIAGGGVGVAVGLALVGPLGAVGVALGQAASMLVANALHAIAARRALGVSAVAPAHAGLVVAGLAAALAGALANAYAPADKYLAFVAVGVAVVAGYVAALALVATADDWALLRGAVRVVRRR